MKVMSGCEPILGGLTVVGVGVASLVLVVV